MKNKRKTENELFGMMMDIFGGDNIESTNIYTRDK